MMLDVFVQSGIEKLYEVRHLYPTGGHSLIVAIIHHTHVLSEKIEGYDCETNPGSEHEKDNKEPLLPYNEYSQGGYINYQNYEGLALNILLLRGAAARENHRMYLTTGALKQGPHTFEK